MRIAIHQRSGSFSDRWVSYCKSNDIAYKIVDCYSSDIISQIADCDALMWHFHQASARDVLFAKQLMYAVQKSGLKVFPDFNTMWHFDDKVGQKYLLEAINAPMVKTWVFYDKINALNWAKSQVYPKVFKLRGGAGSANVRLVTNYREAQYLIKKSFGKGFSQYNALSNLKERIRKFRLGHTDLYDVVKGVLRFIYPTKYSIVAGKEKGYVYFQEYIPDNDHDIRVVVVDEKAFAIKRMVRENDFRASGSGCIRYDKNIFDEKLIRLSFELARKLGTQSVAFDFLYRQNSPLLVEISYGFVKEGYDPCVGYWDSDMNWYPGAFDPCAWMVESLL